MYIYCCVYIYIYVYAVTRRISICFIWGLVLLRPLLLSMRRFALPAAKDKDIQQKQ